MAYLFLIFMESAKIPPYHYSQNASKCQWSIRPFSFIFIIFFMNFHNTDTRKKGEGDAQDKICMELKEIDLEISLHIV